MRKSLKIQCLVGGDCLVGSALMNSGVALWVSRVTILAQGPFQSPHPTTHTSVSPSSLPVSSTLSHDNKGKNYKNKS